MRWCLAVVIATLSLAGCGRAPASHDQPQALHGAPGSASEPQVASLDSTIEFLLTSAATDFRSQRPHDPVRLRDVRLGHVITSGDEQQYMLCGEFLPGQEGGKAEWTPFATIRTSGYEQWLGAQALGLCQGRSVTWHQVGDLTSSLSSRLESLR